MKCKLWLLLVITITGCAGVYRPAIDVDGMYRFKNVPFAVWAPVDCVPDIAVVVSNRTVRFTSGRGDWFANGEFAVHVYEVPHDAFEEDFVTKARKIHQEKADLVKEARLQSEEALSISGNPAYRVVMTDVKESYFISTHIRFPNHVIVAQLVYPHLDVHGARRAIPWNCYERFLRSIERV